MKNISGSARVNELLGSSHHSATALLKNKMIKNNITLNKETKKMNMIEQLIAIADEGPNRQKNSQVRMATRAEPGALMKKNYR